MPRFVLAMLAVLVGSAAVADSLWYSLYADHARSVVLEVCSAGRSAACLAAQRDHVEWAAAFVPLVAAAGLILAGASSWWRHRGTLPTPALPSMSALNAHAAGALGLSPLPVRWRRSRPVATARADGVVRRYIEVGPNMLAMSATDPAVAAAIMRHEYAHHRNSDVLVARWSVASSVVFAALVMWLVVEFWGDDTGSTIAVVVRGLLLALVAVLARSGVLRAREFDADIAAAATAVDGQVGLQRALSGAPVAAAGWRRAVAAFAHHPAGHRRSAVVNEPALLYRPRLSDALLVGLTASIGAPVIARMVSDWAGKGRPQEFAAGIGWCVIGLVLGAWLAATLWRYTVSTAGSDERTDRHLAQFGLTLAAAMLVGNTVFANTLISTSIDIPHHGVDLLASAVLALALMVGVVWTAQLQRSVLRHRSGGTAGTLVVAAAAAAGVCMISALVAFTGYLHSEALFVGSQFDAFVAKGQDPNLPSTLSMLGSLWNHEWMVWVLPALTITGVLFFVTKVSAWRWGLPLVAGAAGAGLLAVARWGFDLVERGTNGGWYSSSQVAATSPLIAGVTIGAVVVVGVHRLQAPVVHAGAFAAIASAVASLAIVTLVLPPGVDTWTAFYDIMPIAVVVSMTLSAMWGATPRLGTRIAVAVTATALSLWAAVSATSAEPSAQIDRGYYWMVLDDVLSSAENDRGSVLDALDACSGDITPTTPTEIDAVVTELDFAGSRPSTEELRDIHQQLIEIVGACRDAAQSAVDEARPRITQAEYDELEVAVNDLLIALERTYPDSFPGSA